MKMTQLALLMLGTLFIVSCSNEEPPAVVSAPVSDAKPASEATAPDVDWTKYGLDNGEARYSTCQILMMVMCRSYLLPGLSTIPPTGVWRPHLW